MKTKLWKTVGIGMLSFLLTGSVEWKVEQTPTEEVSVTEPPIVEEVEPVVEPIEPIVYENMTRQELIADLDRSFTSTLTGKTELFVDHALKVGVDPYLATAIMLEETGCKWKCSALVRNCNNIGGQKGTPSCNGGSYRSYPTLDEGIYGFLNNLSRNYYQKGLTTPEQIGKKYAASTTWASKINRYIKEIKLQG